MLPRFERRRLVKAQLSDSRPSRGSGRFFLPLCWIGGLACGIALGLASGSFLPMMRGADFGTVSIVRLMLTSIFPFLLSALAVSFFPSVLPILCFGKAFLFSFATLALTQAFGTGGWLICRMVLFSDWTLLPLWYLLYLRADRLRFAEGCAILAASVLVVSIHYRVISPYTAYLIEIQKGILG